MPQGVENLFKSASVNAVSPRSHPSRSDGRDVFQKMLDGSRNRPAELKEEPSPRQARPAERSKRSENASRKRRGGDRDEVKLEEQEQTADPGSAEALPETDQSETAVSDAEPSASNQPAEDNVPADAKETIDPLTQALAAAQNAPVAAEPVEIKDDANADESNQAGREGLLKGVAAVVAGATGAGDHASESAADAEDAGNAVKQGATGAAQLAAASQMADDFGDTQTSHESDQGAAQKPRKVVALGQTAPPESAELEHAKDAEKPATPNSFNAAMAAASAVSQFSDMHASADSSEGASPVSPIGAPTGADSTAAQALQPDASKIGAPAEMKAAAAPPLPVRPEAEFAETNHDKIVTSLKSQLMPNGGTMRMRLDPPEMGVLQITVKMRDGAMTASFETSNGYATKLLSHSLGQLKAALESQGISVEKLHVQESPKNQDSQANSEDGRQQPQQHDESARQEQQRKEMLRRMWRRLGIGSDPLDMVA